MKKLFTVIFTLFLSCTLYSQKGISKKVCKYKYEDFKELSINDTSDAVIDLFYCKKESGIYDQVPVLPLSIILVVAPPPAQIIGLGSFVISGPLFISGTYKLIRYRKRKLQKTLTEYREHQRLPTWVRKKTDKLLKEYVLQQIHY